MLTNANDASVTYVIRVTVVNLANPVRVCALPVGPPGWRFGLGRPALLARPACALGSAGLRVFGPGRPALWAQPACALGLRFSRLGC